jgi:hypothetical protein
MIRLFSLLAGKRRFDWRIESLELPGGKKSVASFSMVEKLLTIQSYSRGRARKSTKIVNFHSS